MSAPARPLRSSAALPGVGRLLVVLAAAAAAAWIVGCYLLMTRAPGNAWNGIIVGGPMLASLAAMGRQRRWWWLSGAAGAGLAGLVVAGILDAALPLPWLYLAQYVAIQAVLGALFATSLADGREPLITRMASPLHGARFTPEMARYSRRLTVVWAAYFAAMAVLSVVLFVAAPWGVWTAYANFATPATVFALLAGEHALRYRLHPEFDRATLGDALRAWRRRSHAATPGVSA